MEIITWILDWTSSPYSAMFVAFAMLLCASVVMKLSEV